MLEGLKEKATQPIGPLPAYAWVIVAVGGYFGYRYLSNRNSGSTSSTTAQTVGAAATPVAPSSADFAALTAQISTLGNQVTDLGSKVSTPTSGTSISIPSGWFPTGSTPLPTIPSPGDGYAWIASGPLQNINGQIYQYWSWQLSGPGIAQPLATATQDLGKVAAAPTYPSSTAVQQSVDTPLTGVNTPGLNPAVTASFISKMTNDLTSPSLPTTSTEAIKAATIPIPAMTPSKTIIPKTPATTVKVPHQAVL